MKFCKQKCLRKGLTKTAGLVIILVIVVIGVLAGSYYFGGMISGVEENVSDTSTPSKTSWVIDDYGRNVTLPPSIERIVFAGKGARTIVQSAYAFRSAPEKIVGLDTSSAGSPIVQAVDPYIENKTVMEPLNLNAEEVLALNPDVVIFKSYMRSKGGKQIEESGVPVIYLDMETPETFFSGFMILGKVFGEEDRARELVDYMKSVLDVVDDRVSKVPESERPRVLFLYYSTKGGTIAFKVPGQHWIQNVIVEKAGGISVSANMSSSGWSVVNLEQIIRWNPDYVFVVTYRSDPSPTDIAQQILKDPDWSTVKAVKEGHVYGVPGGFDSWDMPTPKWILCVLWMAKHLYPDLFRDVDVKEKAIEYFMTLYGLPRETAESLVPPEVQ